jgi:uncharacterized protein DUF5685
MFGLVRPCRHTMTQANRDSYRAHMCGACLGIRDQFGQVARVALNRDALVLSMLAEHLSGDLRRTHAGRCPLRGMRSAEVVDPETPSAKYVGAVSLILMEASVNDHAEDSDRGMVLARLVRPSARWYGARARAISRQLGVDLGAIERCVRKERAVRSRSGLTASDYLQHTEEAFALGFSGVASVLGVPSTGWLTELGHAYGGTAAIVDSLEDYDDDLRRGEFNVLAASWPEASRPELGTKAREALWEYRTAIARSLSRLGVQHRDLLWDLLVHSLGARATKALASFSAMPQGQPGPSVDPPRISAAGLASLLSVDFVDDCCGGCCEGCGEACEEFCDGICDCD